MKYFKKYLLLSLLCISFYACDKGENDDSNNFATGIVELPALRNGARCIHNPLYYFQWAESNLFQYGIR